MTTIEKLQKLGLSEKEAIFYYHAARLGEFTILDIARASLLKRPTCYLIADQLLAKNLITQIAGPGNRFAAEDPSTLLESAQEQIRIAQDVTNELHALEIQEQNTPDIKVFIGREQMQRSFDHILKEGKDLYYVGSAMDIVDAVGEVYVDYFIRERIRRDIWTHGLRLEKTETEKRLYKGLPENKRELVFAPEYMTVKNLIGVYGDYVLVFAKAKENFAVRFKNRELAESILQMYEAMKLFSLEHNKNKEV